MENLIFLRIYFLQVIHFIAIQLFVIACYNTLYFFIVCCNLSFFISNFVDFILFSFFLMSMDKGLSILFIFSKKQLLVLLTFTIVSFIYFSLISALIFMIYFLLLILGVFGSSFSSCFRCKLACLFDISQIDVSI